MVHRLQRCLIAYHNFTQYLSTYFLAESASRLSDEIKLIETCLCVVKSDLIRQLCAEV